MWVDSVGLLDFRSSRSLLGLMSYLLSFPSEPVTDSPAHDQFEVAALQPGQLFCEQRDALTPRAGHARDVGAPGAYRAAWTRLRKSSAPRRRRPSDEIVTKFEPSLMNS